MGVCAARVGVIDVPGYCSHTMVIIALAGIVSNFTLTVKERFLISDMANNEHYI